MEKVELTEEEAIEILRQPDRVGCVLIKANDEESMKYNQQSIEAINMALKALYEKSRKKEGTEAKLTLIKTLEDEYGEYIYLSDMPKDNEYVLVQTYRDGYDEYMLTHCTIENGRYLMDNGNEFGERVKAWMSLPTEYKE